jgi:hypothetical protein
MANNPKQTSKDVASKASPLLKKASTPAKVKSVAGSALSQAPFKKTIKKGK